MYRGCSARGEDTPLFFILPLVHPCPRVYTALAMSVPDFVLTSGLSPLRLPFTASWVDSVRKLRHAAPELYSLTRERLVELLHLPQPNEHLLRVLAVSTPSPHSRRGRSTTHAYRLTGCTWCGISSTLCSSEVAYL